MPGPSNMQSEAYSSDPDTITTNSPHIIIGTHIPHSFQNKYHTYYTDPGEHYPTLEMRGDENKTQHLEPATTVEQAVADEMKEPIDVKEQLIENKLQTLGGDKSLGVDEKQIMTGDGAIGGVASDYILGNFYFK